MAEEDAPAPLRVLLVDPLGGTRAPVIAMLESLGHTPIPVGDWEAAERVLAHEIGNKVSGAYRRSDLFDRRIGLMAAWAEHCRTKRTAAPARSRSVKATG